MPTGKARLLLAALLTEPGRVVSTDRLVDILWPEDPPETCRALIHTYVATLRRSLKAGGDLIVTRPPGYLVQIGPDDLDSLAFERLVMDARKYATTEDPTAAIRAFRAAESAWHGPAYAGIDAPAIVAEANRLEELRLAAIEERVDLELRLGRERDLHAELTALVAAHPTHERLRARLMVTLYRLGRQADALAAYHEGRETLVETLGIEPGPELQRTHEAILRGDSTLLPPVDAAQTVRSVPAPRPATPPARPAPPRPNVPAQLPILPTDFTGRAAAVAELVAQLTPTAGEEPAPKTCAIAGRSGAGKSTLALRVAHELAPSFPDGQLYVDLRGATETPTPPVEVLGRFLRALGADPATVPESLEERADQFRTLMSARQVLMVLDDAADEQQVRPLLPGGAGNAVIVTARRRLRGLAGAAHLELGVLDADEAIALLGRVAGPDRIASEPSHAGRLVELCGHLPLAVRIVGARLASRPHWTLAGMAARLADETRRLDELAVADQQVRAGIEVTYRGLDGRTQAALRALSWLDLPDFPAWITALLLDVSPIDGEDAVEALVDAHLLDVTQVDAVGQARYRIHDLIRIYAREVAAATDSPEQRDAGVRRLFDAWVWLIDQVVASTPPGAIPFAPELPRVAAPKGTAPPGIAPSRAWLEAEQPTLVAAVEQAAALGLVDVSVALATALCGSVFPLDNRFEAWSRTHTAALAAARGAGDRASEALLLVQLGQLNYYRDDFASAYKYSLESLSLFRELGDTRGEATAQALLGWICREQGRLAEALHFLHQAHPYFTSASLDAATGYTARLIGTAYLEQGDLERARTFLAESLTAFRRCGSRHGEALSLRSIGLVHRAVGELDAALELCQEALDILIEVGDEKHEAYGLQGVAKTLIRLGRVDEALSMLDRALEISTRLGDTWGRAFMLRTRGEAHLAAGRLEQAERDLTESIRIWTEVDVSVARARSERDLATVLAARGDLAGAAEVRQRALATFKAYGAREYDELMATQS